MRPFPFLTLLVSSVMALSACSSNDGDMSYLGSRDDIIVHNRGVVTSPPKEEENRTATAKETEQKKAAAMVATKMTEPPEKQKDAITEIQTKPMAEQSAPKMNTISMKSPEEEKAKKTATATPPSGGAGDVPPNAKPGECYAKVLIPAVTDKQSERVQVSEEQQVLKRIIPAKYEVQTERVLVKEARQYWKAGQGPITRKDEVTGEIMCLVEEPAVYKTIEKRVLIEPEKPEYTTVPAQFETVTKTNVIKPESWEWRRILCETNMGPNSIERIQSALRSKGYDIAVDGQMGSETMNALNSYQIKNGLATKGITYETLNHLGVQLMGA